MEDAPLTVKEFLPPQNRDSPSEWSGWRAILPGGEVIQIGTFQQRGRTLQLIGRNGQVIPVDNDEIDQLELATIEPDYNDKATVYTNGRCDDLDPHHCREGDGCWYTTSSPLKIIS